MGIQQQVKTDDEPVAVCFYFSLFPLKKKIFFLIICWFGRGGGRFGRITGYSVATCTRLTADIRIRGKPCHTPGWLADSAM